MSDVKSIITKRSLPLRHEVTAHLATLTPDQLAIISKLIHEPISQLADDSLDVLISYLKAETGLDLAPVKKKIFCCIP